jgi:ACS family pantothenate transporter-like MFS transporter
LTTEERELAVSRVPTPQEIPLFSSPTSVLKSLTSLLTSWKLYGFTILWVIAGETESFSSNSLLNLWMKAQKRYTVAQLNNYPSGVPAVGILSTLFWATLTDYWGGRRYLVGYFIGIIGIVTSIMILVRPEDEATVFAAYYIAGSVYACQA